MELEDLKQQFDVYLEIVGDDVEQVGENEWQTTIEDEHHSNISIILTFKLDESKLPYFTSSIELPPFSDFIDFDRFKMKNNEMISNFLVDEESPFFNLYTTLKTLIEEWNDKQGESSSSLFERLERFDEIPIQDSTNESKSTTNYSQSVTIWKDFHYDTLRISTTKNKLEVIEKILDVLKTPDYKYIEKYTIVRYYNDEIWLMKPCTGSVLFDIIFNIDNISQPLSQLMKAFQYLYCHGLFHGNVTKESIVYTPSSNVNVADWVILYLLEGNLYPDSPLLRGNSILKKDLEAIASLIEETIGGMNLSVQLTGFIQALRNHNSIDLTSLIKLAQQIPSTTSNSSMFELGGEYEEASAISEMIGFRAYYRNRDNQFYCFQDIDLTRLPVHIVPEVKTRLYKFCQTHNKYFQYYFFSQPILMVRMSITEVPLNWYLQQKKLLQNKELTRKWFIRITSSIYSLHQESIGHGSLSLKHIFIKDDEIKLAFFDLITPISTVMAKDLISLKKLWIILGWYYFYETMKENELEKSTFLSKLQVIFPETINIQKAKSVEEIMSIVQSFDPKTKQIFRNLLTEQPLLFTLTEYFNQQKNISKKVNEYKPYFTTIDDLYCNNCTFVPADIISSCQYSKNNNVYLASNGCLYKFNITPISITCKNDSPFIYSPFIKNKSYGIEMSSTNNDRSTFSDVLLKTLFLSRSMLVMIDGSAYSLHYNFPTYLIELAKAFNVQVDVCQPYNYLYSQLKSLSVTIPLLKQILNTNETTKLIKLMKLNPKLKKLETIIKNNTISSLLANDESYLCFDVFCIECKSIRTCPHAFLCCIKNLNDGTIVGYATTVDVLLEPDSSSQSLFSTYENTTLKYISNSVEQKVNTPLTQQITKEDITQRTRQQSSSNRKVDLNLFKQNDLVHSNETQKLTPSSQLSSTPLSGCYYPLEQHQESIKEMKETSYGFVCDLIVHSIQPTSQHEYTSQMMIVSSIKSVEPLKLARNLRSEGFTIQTLFKEDIKMEEAKKIIKDYNCDKLILFDGGFKIINEDEIIEIKNINEVVLEIKSGNPINFEYTTLNKVDIGSIMYNETSIKDMHPEIIKAVIVSFENEDAFIKKCPTIKKSFEINHNTKDSPQIMVILKRYDEEYVEFIGKKEKKKKK
ncbi:hypothetical protein KM1_186190 [Entamoeba histolytica HM-3:IMSS]|uniref:Protein kinase domain-containing protein n=1 Tax=Entamoeba histolytica HM-3:IMSS TaxID=885315 RepID=M7WED5_ENTHI|nr:hypothetical protein KM1_186190 [Entamoeba histolytica HM-3:IMSS]